MKKLLLVILILIFTLSMSAQDHYDQEMEESPIHVQSYYYNGFDFHSNWAGPVYYWIHPANIYFVFIHGKVFLMPAWKWRQYHYMNWVRCISHDYFIWQSCGIYSYYDNYLRFWWYHDFFRHNHGWGWYNYHTIGPRYHKWWRGHRRSSRYHRKRIVIRKRELQRKKEGYYKQKDKHVYRKTTKSSIIKKNRVRPGVKKRYKSFSERKNSSGYKAPSLFKKSRINPVKKWTIPKTNKTYIPKYRRNSPIKKSYSKPVIKSRKSYSKPAIKSRKSYKKSSKSRSSSRSSKSIKSRKSSSSKSVKKSKKS